MTGVLSILIQSVISGVLMFIPIHFAVIVLGGESTFKRSFLVVVGLNVLQGLIDFVATPFLPEGLVAMVALLVVHVIVGVVVYSATFSLSPLRAFFLSIVAAVIAFLLVLLVLGAIIGGSMLLGG